MLCRFKNRRRLLNVTILVFLFVPLLIGISVGVYFLSLIGGRATEVYPWKKADHWVCAEPDFKIQYTYDTSGKRTSQELLEWKGKQIEVDVGFRGGVFVVYQKQPDQLEHRTEDLLFEGTWQYDNNNLVMTITADYYFDGTYRELVFIPQ